MARTLADALPPGTEVFFELARAVNLAARPFARMIGRPHRLTLPEWRAMVALARAPGIAASEVASHTGLDKMTVSRALASLERAGRIVREADTADRRRAVARLSPEGEQLFRHLAGLAHQRAPHIFGRLSREELAQLSRLVGKMTESLLEESGED